MLSANKILISYYYLTLFSIFFLALGIAGALNIIFISVIYFSGILAVILKKSVNKTVLTALVLVFFFNLLSAFYSKILHDIPFYISWFVWLPIVFLVLNFFYMVYISNGLNKIVNDLKIIFKLSMLVNLVVVFILLSGDYSFSINFGSNFLDVFINTINVLNNNIGILHDMGFSRGYLSYFSLGLYFFLYSFFNRRERIVYGIFLYIYTIMLGAKAPFLAYNVIFLLMLINYFKMSLLIKSVLFLFILVIMVLVGFFNIEIINEAFMYNGRYIFPVFFYSDFWMHPFGSGFGNYSLFAFKDILSFSIPVYSPLLQDPRVVVPLQDFASQVYGIGWNGASDILFPIAESDLLFFSVQLGAIFTIILFLMLIYTYFKFSRFFFNNVEFSHSLMYLTTFLFFSSLLQDYFNSVFPLLFFSMVLILSNRVKVA